MIASVGGGEAHAVAIENDSIASLRERRQTEGQRRLSHISELGVSRMGLGGGQE